MSNDPDEILDGLFHACAFAAFLDEAHAQQGWPDIEATRRRAFAYFEEELAASNAARSPVSGSDDDRQGIAVCRLE